MTDTVDRTARYVERFAEFVESLDEQDAAPERQSALAAFAEMGFPTAHDEEWRYTNLAPLLRQEFAPFPGIAEVPESIERWRVPDLDSHLLVFVDGRYQPALSSVDALGNGVRVGNLAASLWEGTEQPLGRIAPRARDAFVELNTAFLQDGAFIYVDKGVRVDQPIEVLFIAACSQATTHPRLWVCLEEGAQATLVERYVSSGDQPHLSNALAEFQVGENAHLEHYRMQDENDAAFHVSNLYVREQRSSVFSSTCCTLGGALTRNHVHTQLMGEGIHSTLNGLYVVEGAQHVDNHTLIEHARPHCQSHEFYKGILADESTGVFRGQILVHQAAQKTDAYQANRNLLLSDRAEINTKPQLEIYADDVKCSHGATIGQLDEDAVFYLRSRGIGRAAARRVLTRAFAGEVVERVRLKALRDDLEARVGARLERAVAHAESD